MIIDRAFLAVVALILATASGALGGTATWKTNPESDDWNTAANWKPASVPDGPSDQATFAFSNRTDVSLSSGIEVDGIVFGAGASSFTVNVNPVVQPFQLFLSGTGITNTSGVSQHFVTGNDAGDASGEIIFANSAVAGSMTVFTNKGGVVGGAGGSGGGMFFTDRATADHATFINRAGTVAGAGGGFVFFQSGATAGDATLTNEGAAVAGAGGGQVRFFVGSNAGNALLINNGGTVSGASGGITVVDGGKEGAFTTSGANATFIADGGTNGGSGGSIIFDGKTHTGGKSRIEVFGNGTFAIDQHRSPNVAVGSIEGDGIVILGANNLTVGANNLATTFAGTIKDGPTGSGGSLIKVGNTSLFLTNTSTYSGGTLVTKGRFFVSNQSGSATGTGPVQVNGGTLEGNGIIGGPVTLGNGTGDTILLPFANGFRRLVLTIKSTLTLNSGSQYQWLLNSYSGKAWRVSASGVTINGSSFAASDFSFASLPPGTVFTAINNTSAMPIAGTFSNLPDGSKIVIGVNTFSANYEGGDGNDLTLTVQ